MGIVGPHPGPRIAPRREILILLPVALLLLALLSTYSLLSYRSAIALLVERRQAEAAQLARQLSADLVSERGLPGTDALRRRLPQASAVSILDAAGNNLVGAAVRAAADIDPGVASGVVAGSARFKKGTEILTVRVELPAAILRGRQRGLRILSPVLLSVNGAITLLVLLFLRRFLAPFDRLVEKARHAGQQVPDSQDEVIFLVETFEKALEALARPAHSHGAIDSDPARTDELKTLENTLARSIESGVLLLDADGIVLALNEIGACLLGIDAQRTGEPAAVLLDRHPKLAALLERSISRRRTVQRQECVIERSGCERILGVTAHPLRRDDAALRGFLVIFADLTEVQKEVRERRLVDSLSQLGELTAGVAHEMRNSLATLRGYLALIERGREGESVDDFLGEIRRESDHLQRVLEDFLTFARPGSARLQDVDLLGLVHRAAADPTLGAATIALDVESDGPTIEVADTRFQVRGDPQLLERALRNILSNAVEAQREAARAEPVRARLERRDAGVEISIEDRGGGISPDIRDKIFDPFFSRRAEGVGMGLALTRRIVLLHAGRVELESRPGGGTRAVIWIPLGKAVTEGNSHDARAAPA